jgi:hypothetical protein
MGHGICQLWVQGLVGCECLADLFGDGVGGHAVASEGEVFHAVAFVWVPSWMVVVVVVTWTRWPLTVACVAALSGGVGLTGHLVPQVRQRPR